MRRAIATLRTFIALIVWFYGKSPYHSGCVSEGSRGRRYSLVLSLLSFSWMNASITQAAMNGVSERDIMRQTGHKSAEMLARYIRIGEIFTRNAAAGLGI